MNNSIDCTFQFITISFKCISFLLMYIITIEYSIRILVRKKNEQKIIFEANSKLKNKKNFYVKQNQRVSLF